MHKTLGSHKRHVALVLASRATRDFAILRIVLGRPNAPDLEPLTGFEVRW